MGQVVEAVKLTAQERACVKATLKPAVEYGALRKESVDRLLELIDMDATGRVRKKWTVKEAADFLSVNERTVENYTRRGWLHPTRVGVKSLRYNPDEVENFAAGKTEVSHD